MTAADLITALGLPDGTRVDQRVPKKLLVEHGAPTAADKRQINEGVEEIRWVATLKPATIGVPAYRDDSREYLEIAVLHLALRSGVKARRLNELAHRAIPYPLWLVTEQASELTITLAHKRWSQGEAGKTVLDGEVSECLLQRQGANDLEDAFVAALPLAGQPRTNLYALYQGWIDTLHALLVSRVTGIFAAAQSPTRATDRHAALREYVRLDAEADRLRAAAAKERQMARQVELNLELKRIEAAQAAARERL
jgi:hypothetical protein